MSSVRNHHHCTIRVNHCRCGDFLSLEITEDMYQNLLRRVGSIYGTLKGLPEEEATDG